MMQVIPHCPHCDKELPGWRYPSQETTGGSWKLTDPPSPQWRLCPLCKGSGIDSFPVGITGYPTCSFCHGAKVVATP